ncbi:MAG: glycoside hydrolase family 31 protein [Lachnospiraceae bacterium]|nr:glycoside hydrolase family 31 protein [Lachnospiraceae bacterium]
MFGRRKGYEVKEGIVYLTFDKGCGQIEVLTDEIINVFSPLEREGHHSKAIEGDKSKHVYFEVKEGVDFLEIITASLVVRVYDHFHVDFYDKGGRLLCADYRGNREFATPISDKFIEFLIAEGHEVPHESAEDYRVQVIKRMEGDECFYGLGDKTGVLNKRHYDYEMWNSDIPQAHTDAFKALYKSVPFLITLRKEAVYGIFFDNPCKSYFDLGKEQDGYYLFGADQGNLDYYFIGGTNMAEVIRNYTYLTGRTPLPQLFTLGYHQSRWGYETSAEIRAIADKYRALDIPIDTIHFDIDYMDGYRVFTWNERDFGEPGKVIRELEKKGFKVVTIIDPGVKKDPDYDVYREGIEQGYFVKMPEGEVYENEVWPGEAVYPDFGNPKVRAWWADKQKYLVELGVRGVWTDMNEPASFRGELPEDIVFSDESEASTHAAMHNVYGHLMSRATYEGLVRHDGRRPFVITRACYAGTQKYSTMWTGDNQSLWDHLRMAIPQMCNMGLSGLAFVGTDVGGFGADATPELLSRWVQLGCFSPLFRNHSSKGSTRQEPWVFGEETLRINQKYIRLRYRLLPYLYDLFYETGNNGLPIIRPLVLHYEKDEECKNLNTEFLFGAQMLIAPVVEQGMNKKLVYLPEGTWYDYDTMEKHTGGQYLIKSAPIDICPVFVKAGSIIPNYPPMHYVGEIEVDNLTLDVYPGEGHYIHYQDNGEDFAYLEGGYNAYECSLSADETLIIKLIHKGYAKVYRQFTIRYKGREQQFEFNGDSLTVWLS